MWPPAERARHRKESWMFIPPQLCLVGLPFHTALRGSGGIYENLCFFLSHWSRLPGGRRVGGGLRIHQAEEYLYNPKCLDLDSKTFPSF